LRQLRNLLVHCAVVGGGDDQHHAIEMLRLEARDSAGDARLRGQFGVDLRGDHAHLRARLQQHGGLALGDIAAADHQAGLALDVGEDGQKVHISP
jgi:hypothetical protein